MEPTGSGQIEIERERVPSFLRTPIRASQLGKYIPICCIGGDTYLILKKWGAGMGKTHVLFFLLKIFLKTISTRDIKKRPATLHILPTLGNDQDTSEEGFQFIHTPFIPDPAY